MSDTCPVCGKGEFRQGGFFSPVSHLACVAQANEVMRVAVEANGRLEAENERLTHLYGAESRVRKAMDKRAEKAEAELKQTKAFLRITATELKQAEADHREAEEENNSLRTRAFKAEAENAGLRSHQACTKRAEQAEAELAKRTTERDYAVGQLDIVRAELSTGSERIRSLKAALAALKAKLAVWEDDNEDYDDRLLCRPRFLLRPLGRDGDNVTMKKPSFYWSDFFIIYGIVLIACVFIYYIFALAHGWWLP